MKKIYPFLTLITLFFWTSPVLSKKAPVKEYNGFYVLQEDTKKCEATNKNYHTNMPINSKCSKANIPNVGTCYKDCYCLPGYKNSSGTCIAKTCSDYADYSSEICPKNHKCKSQKKLLGSSKDPCYSIVGCKDGFKSSSNSCIPMNCKDYGYLQNPCDTSQETTEHLVASGNSLLYCYSCQSCPDGYKVNEISGKCEMIRIDDLL